MRRLLLVPTGLLLGFVAAGGVLIIGLLIEAAAAPADVSLGMTRLLALMLDLTGQGLDPVGFVVMAVWRALLWLCLAPLCVVVAVAEAGGLRSLRWLAGGTGVLAALAPTILRAGEAGANGESLGPLELRLSMLLLLSGVAAGTLFWLIAGRRESASR